jgi:predicted N-acetyltransferase YhbS
MTIVLRPGTAADAAACGTICYDAFRLSARPTTSRRTLPSAEVASGLLSMLLAHPGFYSVTAELDGRIVGSNFMDERSRIAGVGPITVDPTVQNRGVGARLMQDVIDRAARRQVIRPTTCGWE